MKNYLIIGALVVVSIVGIWLLAARSDESTVEPENESATPTMPQVYDPAQPAPETLQFSSEYNPALTLSYPIDWNITEGAENSTDQQLVTFESPVDDNGSYYCLDLTEVAASSDTDFETAGATIQSVDSFMADGIGKNLSSVIFNVEDGGNLLWSVIDGRPGLEENQFTNLIASPAGRSLQTLGRFNCRDADSPVNNLQEFTNSRWFNQAQTILRSLSY